MPLNRLEDLPPFLAESRERLVSLVMGADPRRAVGPPLRRPRPAPRPANQTDAGSAFITINRRPNEAAVSYSRGMNQSER